VTRALYGQTLACACGRTHTITPHEICLEDAALDRLPALLEHHAHPGPLAVLMDLRTQDVAGTEAARTLRAAGWTVQEVVVPDPARGASPVCDEATKDWLAHQIRPAHAFLTVGSGVVSDLGKWLSFERDVPYVSFATAASMNGYASANVAPTIAGLKTLVRARPPVAVAASLPVLQAAPAEMTASGLGDILAKSVSSTDWLLNHALFGDYFCQASVDLIAQIEPLYLEHPEEVRDAAPRAVEALFQGLLLTGVAMTMAETSAPSSGAEHMLSHALDMMSAVDGTPHDLHGRQVGLGTILASEIYARVLALDAPAFRPGPAGIDRAFWGPLADAVQAAYAEKADRLRTARERLARGTAWDELRARLAPGLRSPARIRDCLARARAAHKPEHIRCTGARLLAALAHAHEIRSRFTILDLAHLTGLLPGQAGEIVEAWG